MPGDGFQAETLDFGVAHAGEEIPLRVVLAQVFAAKPLAISEIVSRLGDVHLGGFKATWLGAALAGFCRRTRLRPLRIDADVVTEAGTVAGRTHGLIMGCKV